MRYASIEQLNDDIGRYLDGRPVLARRGRTTYRVGKWMRRKKALVAAGTLIIASLVGGAFATARQARHAEAERAKAERINTFVRTMLGAAQPEALGRDVTVREALDSASVQAGRSLRDEPRSRKVCAAPSASRISGSVAFRMRSASCSARCRSPCTMRDRTAPRPSRRCPTWVSYVPPAGDFVAAESIYTRALALKRSLGKPDDDEVATFVGALGSAAMQRGRYADAERFERQALALRRDLRDDGFQLATTANNLAITLGQRGAGKRRSRFIARPSRLRAARAASRIRSISRR